MYQNREQAGRQQSIRKAGPGTTRYANNRLRVTRSLGEDWIMKRAIYAALAVLGFSLVSSVLMLAANAYTNLEPSSYTYEGNNN
jgi:hypothetical protein